MIPATSERVEQNTAEYINEARQAEIEANVRYYAAWPDKIPARLAELDREWDIERVLETNAAAVSLAGLALAAFVDRRFLVVPAAVAGFLLQHAVQGWCPPLPLMRRLGIRTPAEIGEERCRLRMLCGQHHSSGDTVPAQAQRVARMEEIHEGVDA